MTLFWNFLHIFLTISIFKTFWCKGRDPSYPCLSLTFLSLVIRKMKIGPFHQSFQTVIKFYLNLNHVLQCENFYAQKSYSKGKCIWGLDHHNFADFWKKKVIIWKRKITLYKLVRYFSDILIRMFKSYKISQMILLDSDKNVRFTDGFVRKDLEIMTSS